MRARRWDKHEGVKPFSPTAVARSGTDLHHHSIWAGDAGRELWFFSMFDANIKTECRAKALQFSVVWTGNREAIDFATAGRVGGGMNGAGVPLDEERQHFGVVVFKVQSLPLQKPAIGAFSRAGNWALECDAAVSEAGGKLGDIARMGGPGYKARLS